MLTIDIVCRRRPDELLQILEKIHSKKQINMEINLYADTFKLFTHCYKEKVDMVLLVDQISAKVDKYDMAYYLKAANEHIMPVIIEDDILDNSIDKKAGRSELFECIPHVALRFVLPDLIEYANKRAGEKDNILLSYRWKAEDYEVALDKILYFYSEHRVIKYVTADGSRGMFYQKLDVVEEALREVGVFVRVSKSFLLNRQYILSATKNEVVMIDNTRVSVSRAYRTNIKGHIG